MMIHCTDSTQTPHTMCETLHRLYTDYTQCASDHDTSPIPHTQCSSNAVLYSRRVHGIHIHIAVCMVYTWYTRMVYIYT